jgi:cytosine/adenosine deaminase-related metal-dependent hydrolase
MIILKDAFVLTLNPQNDFGQYSILIDGNTITEIAATGELAPAERDKTKLQKWIEKYGSYAEVKDCSSKIIMPAVVNSCLKSEASFIKYLMKNRHYENNSGDLYTDFIFNYLYQDSTSAELQKDLERIYRYSFGKALKSGIGMFNELSMRKDMSHIEPVSSAQRYTGQKVTIGYPMRQDYDSFNKYKNIEPAYYFTDENQMTVYDLSSITELKRSGIKRLFFEVATNKTVTDEFRRTFGKPVVRLLDEYGLVDSNTSFINPLYLTYDEIKIIAEKNTNIIICPRDLFSFSNRYFPVDDFINNNIKFSIATGWLGDDIFKEVRIFRNRYKELNIPCPVMLKAITQVPYDLYFSSERDACELSIGRGKPANLAFIDLSDIRFQFYPESFDFEHVCTFMLDNISALDFSDIILNGDFKVRDSKPLYFDEEELVRSAYETRERLYKTAKYVEISARQKQKKSVEKLDLSSRDDDEIKLFSVVSAASEETEFQSKEEFRIKGRIPVFRKKVSPKQKNLFEQTDTSQVVQSDQYQETPVINLLYTELDQVKGMEEEVMRNKIADEKIMKQVYSEKKKQETVVNEDSKVELPKNVKLKFGDD